MKFDRTAKNTAPKKNPFTATPAPVKVATKPVAETKPAPAKVSAPIAKSPVVASPAVVTKPAEIAAPVAKAKVAETKPLSKASRSATIEAKIDVGFGNTLYLRGEGKGLNWNQGIPLTNVDGSTWQWSGEADEKLKVKLLLNDAVWAKGEDLIVAPGEKVQIAPAF